MKKIFKKLTIVLSCLTIGLTGGLLVACGKDDPKATNKITSTQDLYGFAAMTTGMVLQDISTNPIALEAGSNEYSAMIDEVDKYINIFETIVGGTSPIVTEKGTVETEYNSYNNKIIVKTNDLAGNSNSYSIYFNEGEPEYIPDDDDEFEIHTAITGLLVISNDQPAIALAGTKIVENDEIELILTATLNGQSIRFSQEFEAGETEYKYEIKNGNNWYEMFSFEIEVKNNKTEIELEAIINEQVYDFEIEQITLKGVDYLEVSFKQGTQEYEDIRVSVVKENNKTYYQYTLPNGEKIKKVR